MSLPGCATSATRGVATNAGRSDTARRPFLSRLIGMRRRRSPALTVTVPVEHPEQSGVADATESCGTGTCLAPGVPGGCGVACDARLAPMNCWRRLVRDAASARGLTYRNAA